MRVELYSYRATFPIRKKILNDTKHWEKGEEDKLGRKERVKWRICKPQLEPESAQYCNTSIEEF